MVDELTCHKGMLRIGRKICPLCRRIMVAGQLPKALPRVVPSLR
ncbi:hypothetical protein AB395_00002177 [Sinorhizobium fredii CCBAU 45436]|nr:hypothetical protein SF83666_c21680 [Sinorhizobium fredii CCBAU 83666]AWI57830.1 hypothetical protein AB395_00002177 [Sinorhizobium fredii CCBAU 45436]AWM25676.1 hypothetical protein AOX55_00002425 [Sinorhizobium fredii CCBAU 25509]